MKNKLIRLTESDLHNIVKNVLIESAYEKRKILRHLYKIAEPFTHSKYRDTGWNGVDQLIKALRDNGFDVDVSVKDGGYRNSAGGNTLYPYDSATSYWKEYLLKIDVDGIEIHGHINCNFCGTMNDPFSTYDMTVGFY